MAEATMTKSQATTVRQPMAYEPPSIRAISEKEILETFQITQAMASWWGAC
jgi:hypothetical protein